MSPTEGPLWRRSASDLARAITSAEVSSREVVEAHLQRTGEVNPALNAITVLLADAALAAADEADRKRERGEPLGPLHGVPFTIKEEIDVVGSARGGSLAGDPSRGDRGPRDLRRVDPRCCCRSRRLPA